jgi:uncharacterized peroxidase-related enzyme
MPFIHTTPTDEATDKVRDMYERQRASDGFVPNYAKVFSLRPELMTRWAGLLSGIRRHVEPRRFELVTLAAAHALRSSYCSLAHGKALTAFFSEEEVQAIAVNGDLAPLSPAETVMMNLARKVARDASAVTAGDVAELQKHGFTDEEIFDVVATAAARSFFTKLLDGLGAEADVHYMDMDEALRRSLTVGRPIAFR